MSYCPFKKNTQFKTRYNGLVEYESQRIAQVDQVFGECDGSRCMAYDSDDGSCKLMRAPHTIVDNSGGFPWA